MIWFTSDIHLDHEKIRTLCERPFESVAAMNDVLLKNWNDRVGDDDLVYIIGDLMYEDCERPEYWLARLNGRKILITGNHDAGWLSKVDTGKYFEKVVPYLEIEYEGIKFTLCHYPMIEWPTGRIDLAGSVGYLVHGHTHNYAPPRYISMMKTPFLLNASAEINGYAPVGFDELIGNNEAFKLENLESSVDRARFVAMKYHEGQKDKSGKAYILHPQKVAAGVSADNEKTVAWLHDVIEDTDFGEEKLRKYFSPEIAEAVMVMTHCDEEPYFDYIKRIKAFPLARAVKLSDLAHNSDLSRLPEITEKDIERANKYKKAIEMLSI